MKIKRLEISGFKSFADKVLLDFQQGVTGVVGPNGCGKSNIVDAIRWCMGEQSAKNLRGKGMEDLIFAGSEGRKPLGMAEVSLVFSTEDGKAPARYLEFSEIQLTRRLYRDGESEYLINRVPCRLMDIAELFMDTGVGTRAYSIIEQGKIGQILHSRPEERRILIEEAAGVTKYKARKQLALRKIEGTQQNLLRLSDLIGEIKRQLNGLQRQARKAQLFRDLRDEARQIEQLFMLQQSEQLAGQLALTEGRLEDNRQQMAGLTAATEQAELECELLRVKQLAAEKQLSELQEQLFKVKGGLVATENSIGFRRKERENLIARVQRLENELESATVKQKQGEEELQLLQRRKEEHGREMLEAEEQLQLLQRDQHAEELGLDTVRSRLELMRRELFNASGEAARSAGRYEQAVRRIEQLQEKAEKQRHEKLLLLEREEESRTEQRMVAEQIAGNERGLQLLEEQITTLTAEQQQLAGELPLLESRLSGLRDQLGVTRSRLASLQELEASFEGYGQGVKWLMTESPLKGRFTGLLADSLLVPEQYERAVEAALAERLQVVICKNGEDLNDAVDCLRNQNAGRVQLVALGHAATVTLPIEDALPLSSLLELKGFAFRQAEPILAGIYLVESLDKAVSLAGRYAGCSFVTRDGDLVSADGVLTVGRSGLEGGDGGLIHKKREIRSLAERLQLLEEQVQAEATAVAAVRKDYQQLAEQLQESRGERHQLELLLAGLRKDLQQKQRECENLAERLELFEYEQGNMEEELVGQRGEEAAAQESEKRARGTVAELEGEIEAASAAFELQQRTVAAVREAVTAGRVQVATLQQELQAGDRAINMLTNRIVEQQELQQRGLLELEGSRDEIRQLDEWLDRQGAEMQQLLARQVELEKQFETARLSFDLGGSKVAEAEGLVRQRRAERENCRIKGGELSIELASIRMQQENLTATLRERHRTDFSELKGQLSTSGFDPERGRIRQVELERQIEELGEVNLLAIEEYDKMLERHDFLAGQRDDLEGSMQDLQQAIQSINRTTRKRFQEAFTKINEKFQEVFPRLFCGGTAELRLTDEQNLLETGIDIVVQPPGKRLSNLMLLSGGEKALTAVALIFAIFLIKPTPFCLLDEVDAPLDDANIGRFNEMVREMSSISQFIIITHNKATMAVADTLYGITMEEPGASRLVSVRLH